MTAHKSIIAALAAAQSEMEALTKNAANPHFRSKYADLSAVVAACQPALGKHGIAVYQPIGEDEHGRYVETVLAHEAGELRCRVPLIVGKNDMQGFGSAVTYARRYGLMAMTGLAPEDDDGNAAAKSPPPKEEPKPAPAVSADDIKAALDTLGTADSEESLRAIWKALPKPLQAQPTLVAAAQQIKARITAPPTQSPEDLLDDEIPNYE